MSQSQTGREFSADMQDSSFSKRH